MRGFSLATACLLAAFGASPAAAQTASISIRSFVITPEGDPFRAFSGQAQTFIPGGENTLIVNPPVDARNRTAEVRAIVDYSFSIPGSQTGAVFACGFEVEGVGRATSFATRVDDGESSGSGSGFAGEGEMILTEGVGLAYNFRCTLASLADLSNPLAEDSITINQSYQPLDTIRVVNVEPPPSQSLPAGGAQTFTATVEYTRDVFRFGGFIQLVVLDGFGNELTPRNDRNLNSSAESVGRAAQPEQIQITLPDVPVPSDAKILLLAEHVNGNQFGLFAPAAFDLYVDSELLTYGSEETSIDRIEVIQVIQTPDNSVPLIANKQTIVRVFVQSSGGGSAPEVVLRGERNGQELPGSPLRPQSNTLDEYGALQFLLPDQPVDASWVGEGVTRLIAEAEVDGAMVEGVSYTANFQPAAPLAIRYVAICRDSEQNCPHPVIAKLDQRLRDLYPIDESKYSYGPVPVPKIVWEEPIVDEWRLENGQWRRVQTGYTRFRRLFRRYHAKLVRKGKLAAGAQLIGFVPPNPAEFITLFDPPREVPCGSGTRTQTQATYNGVSDPLWGGGGGLTMLVRGPANGSQAGGLLSTFAHEIGHNLGLSHPGPPFDPGCSQTKYNSYWPYQDVKIQGFGYLARKTRGHRVSTKRSKVAFAPRPFHRRSVT